MNTPAAGIDLICIPFHDWRKCRREGFRTRDAHLILALAADPRVRRVLVVDRPIAPPELARNRTAQWRVGGGPSIGLGPGIALTRLQRKIFVLDILMPDVLRVLAQRHGWIWDVMDRGRVATAVRRAGRRLQLARPALLLSSPLYAPITRHIQPAVLVFDAIDNLLEHPELAYIRPTVAAGYEQLRREADLIFTTSAAVRDWLGAGRERVWFLPNGVDPTEFQPTAPHPLPADLAALPRPLVGYAGKMQQRIDTDLVCRVAGALPGVSFVFIGPILDKAWLAPLLGLPNVHFLGDKHYRQLPDYLAAFAVCLIPHRVGKEEHGSNVLKLYEYMAMGRPIVTTPISGVEPFAARICIAADAPAFSAGIQQYLDAAAAGQPVPHIADPLPAATTWAAKAALMLDRIAERMGG
ncbi:MAG: glycosyltransferase [Chloroflexota bacterium]|nr:glycosyltransferase [Chloroflexota bacterium]